MKAALRDLGVTLLLGIIALTVMGYSGWYLISTHGGTPALDDAEKSRIAAELAERKILDFSIEGSGSAAVVHYTYQGGRVPDEIVPGEVPVRRTSRSFTRSVSQGKDASGVMRYTYETASFAQDAYTHQADGWYYVEYGSAPRALFDNARKESPLSFLFGATQVFADTIFSGAGDGQVDNSTTLGTGNPTAWNTNHDSTSGTSFNYTGTSLSIGVNNADIDLGGKLGHSYGQTNTRAFLPFDTSAIPGSATIFSASVNLYATGVLDGTDANGGTSDYVAIMASTTQAAYTALANSDFNKCGLVTNPIEASNTHTDLGSMGAGNYYSFPLNSTGLQAVRKNGQSSSCTGTAGITCLGVREGYDAQRSAPPLATTIGTGADSVSFSSSEESGTSQDPYLLVTYSGTFAPWQFWDF